MSKTPQKKEISATHHTLLNTKLSELKESLAEDYSLLCCLEVASEKGASSWLTAKPIKEHGFVLHKGAFIDAIHLRYGLTPPRLPPNCVYGSNFIVEHALNCKCGDFPSIRHNELHDITADLLTETSSDVMMEPLLQSLSGEVFKYRTTITDDNARADIAVSNFWSPCLRSFFDVRVFNLFSSTYNKCSLKQCHKRNEMEKRRQYEERIRIVEHGSFTPLVSAGGMGPAANIFFKHLASLLTEHHSTPYSQILNWIRCRICFSLLRSSITCLRGARLSYHCPINLLKSLDHALSEGRVSS